MNKIQMETGVFDGLHVDQQLRMSHGSLSEIIKMNMGGKRLMSGIPSVSILADLALQVYENLEDENLPDGWKLLTTAFNSDISNGYHGAAFYHPEKLQCIVCHRGTEWHDIGDVLAAITGIFFNRKVAQIDSACTFADEIVKTLKAVGEENEENKFELFITGHSLGGWLAQVTTFCISFLKRDGETFARLEKNDDEPYRAQAIVFDTPGCLQMLLKLKRTFESSEREPIALEGLSVTSYLSPPNRINTHKEHFGRIFRVMINTENMGFFNRNFRYTEKTHSIKNIAKYFNSEEVGQVQEVKEWPRRKGIFS